MDDDDLVLAVLRGDRGAWRVLGPRLYVAIRPCFRAHFGEADADDLAQNTLIIIHRRLRKFEVRAGKPIGNWARVIARSQVQEELRQRRRRERLANGLAQVEPPPSTNLSVRLDRAELRADHLALVREALEKLATPYRRVIENDLAEGDIDEFAEREGLERGSVRTRRRRAYKKLRQLVRELGGTAPTPPKT